MHAISMPRSWSACNLFDAFQLDAIAYPGNSGSPHEPATGQVVGVINSVFVKESKGRYWRDPPASAMPFR